MSPEGWQQYFETDAERSRQVAGAIAGIMNNGTQVPEVYPDDPHANVMAAVKARGIPTTLTEVRLTILAIDRQQREQTA